MESRQHREIDDPSQREDRLVGLTRKAVATIRKCVDVSVLQDVANDTNAYEMWQKLSGL